MSRFEIVIENCSAYEIGPRPQTNEGHYEAEQASNWYQNEIWSGNCRVFSKGSKCVVVLEDSETGKVFGKCEYHKEGSFERVIDSGRYFVLRVEMMGENRHQQNFIGIGFEERVGAFDLRDSLNRFDSYRPKKRKKESDEDLISPSPKNYSLKEGEKIKIKNRRMKPRRKDVDGDEKNISLDLGPPPGGFRSRRKKRREELLQLQQQKQQQNEEEEEEGEERDIESENNSNLLDTSTTSTIDENHSDLPLLSDSVRGNGIFVYGRVKRSKKKKNDDQSKIYFEFQFYNDSQNNLSYPVEQIQCKIKPNVWSICHTFPCVVSQELVRPKKMSSVVQFPLQIKHTSARCSSLEKVLDIFVAWRVSWEGSSPKIIYFRSQLDIRFLFDDDVPKVQKDEKLLQEEWEKLKFEKQELITEQKKKKEEDMIEPSELNIFRVFEDQKRSWFEIDVLPMENEKYKILLRIDFEKSLFSVKCDNEMLVELARIEIFRVFGKVLWRGEMFLAEKDMEERKEFLIDGWEHNTITLKFQSFDLILSKIFM